jgi:hypothetical protein
VKFAGLTLAAALLVSCSRNIQTKEAVREAVVEYLNAKQAQTGLNMAAMNVEVVSMSFAEDKARVTMSFQLKTGEGGMQMAYDLDRQGNQWVVRGAGTPAGGAASALPPNHPPVGGGAPPPPGPPPAGSKE